MESMILVLNIHQRKDPIYLEENCQTRNVKTLGKLRHACNMPKIYGFSLFSKIFISKKCMGSTNLLGLIWR